VRSLADHIPYANFTPLKKDPRLRGAGLTQKVTRMTDPIIDVPETQIDNDAEATVTVVDAPVTPDVEIEITSTPAETPAVEETLTPLPSESEVEEEVASDVPTAEEPVTVVASDVTPTTATTNEVTKEVTAPRQPDTRPKRRLGWRAYILGGSGGTK